MANQNTQDNKGWLQRLKDESWEAELLISTIAIFGTLQLFKLGTWGTNKFIDIIPPDQYFIGYIIIYMGTLAISILAAMFISHFILRAYWVGLVGLNSVFPDYSLEDSVYSKIYTQKVLSFLPKLKDTIHKADELCSVIFSAAFFMLYIYTYFAIISSAYLFFYNTLSDKINHTVLLIPLYLIAAVFIFNLVITILANIKAFKNKAKLQNIFFLSTKWSSMIYMGPLYKNMMQITMTFASNYKKKKAITLLTILITSVGFFTSMSQVQSTNISYLISQESFFDSTRIYPFYYQNKSTETKFLLSPQINADIIKNNIVEVFVPIYKYEGQLHENICGAFESDIPRLSNEYRSAIRNWNATCYNNYIDIQLNDKNVDIQLMKYKHPNTNQYGVIAYIPLKDIEQGTHSINIVKQLDTKTYKWTIPFHYVGE